MQKICAFETEIVGINPGIAIRGVAKSSLEGCSSVRSEQAANPVF